MTSFKTLFLTNLISIVFCVGHAQQEEARKKIIKQTNIIALKKIKNKADAEYQKLIQLAQKRGVSLSGKNNYTLAGYKNGAFYFDRDDNVNTAKTSRATSIQIGGDTNFNLSGKDITVGLWEASGVPLKDHVEFTNNRLTIKEDENNSDHATHVAGTIIASGIDEQAKGLAFGANIEARRSNNDEAEMALFAMEGGLLSNHSYSSSNPKADTKYYGYYSSLSQLWDEIAYNAPYYLIIKSAGNSRNDGYNNLDRGYDLLFSQGVSKNPLVVGAVKNVSNYTGPKDVEESKFSSYGPTDDWRIKPDIVTNGVDVFSTDSITPTAYTFKSGTSMSTPAITGVVALLQEHYYNLNQNYLKSASVKALLINTANECGSYEGPDFANGWGLVNAERAAHLIANNNDTALILEKTLNNNSTSEFQFTTDGSNPLFLTMAWTDPPANSLPEELYIEDQGDLMLVNDLDVRIISEDGSTTYFPWIIEKLLFFEAVPSKGDNFRDNVEKIEIDNIPAGVYTVQVSHKNQLENNVQEFSIAIEGIGSSTLSTPNFNNVLTRIYPNPAGNYIFIKLNNDLNIEKLDVLLYDISGKVIKNESLQKNDNGEFKLNTKYIKSGIYFLNIKTANKFYTKKISIN